MNDPNITIKEYIRLEEEKAQRCGKVFNWEAARYGKIWYDDDVDDLRSVETEFLAIVFNDNLKKSLGIKTPMIRQIEFYHNFFTPHTQTILPLQFLEDYLLSILIHTLFFIKIIRMAMEHHDDASVVVFTSRAWERLFDTRGPLLGGVRRRLSWRQFILALGLHTEEEMGTLGFARYLSENKRMIPGKGDLHNYWRDISTDGDFLGPPPSYTLIRDPVLRLCHRMMAHSIAGRSQTPKKVTVTDLLLNVGLVNIPYLLAQNLRRFAARRKSGAHISGGQFVARLAAYFGLLTPKIL
ncbi:hypothetical protein Tco_0444931 [Tanacetum coccineum]